MSDGSCVIEAAGNPLGATSRGRQIIAADTNPLAAGVGGGIDFYGVYTVGGDRTQFGGIRGFKTNATATEYGGGLKFYTREQGVGTEERLTILESGNVGIGSDAPTQKLDVDGNIQGGTIYSNLFSVANEGKVVSTATAGLLLQATAGSKPITFHTNVGGMIERMRIAADGSVGMGIDDPAENLEVSGNVVIGQSTDGLTTDTSWLSLDGYYEHGLVIKGYGNWTQWRVSSKVNGNLEIYNTGASDLDQQVYIGHTEAVRDANVFVWTTGSVLSAGRNSETYPILDLGIQDAVHGYNGDAYIDVRTSTTPPSRFHFKKDGEFIASGVSVTGTVAGTGAGGRITLNGTGYLLSGDVAGEADTLQTVTDRGATTTTNISGAEITGTVIIAPTGAI